MTKYEFHINKAAELTEKAKEALDNKNAHYASCLLHKANLHCRTANKMSIAEASCELK